MSHVTHLSCSTCGQRVSNDIVQVGHELVVRAYIECPECVERGHAGRRFLTVEEVADRLRVSKMSVYRLTNRGEIPMVKVGNSRRIRVAALDAYIEAGGSP